MKKFNNRVRELRLKANLTQTELAKDFHTTKAAISRWENGWNNPDANILANLASYFHVSVDYLIGASADKPIEVDKNKHIDTIKFSRRIKELRKGQRLTQKDLASIFSQKDSSISHWENNLNLPDPETLFRLGKYFNVSVDYLLGISDFKNFNEEMSHLLSSGENIKDYLIIPCKIDLGDFEKYQIIDFVNYLISKHQKS